MFCRSISWFICVFVAIVIARSVPRNDTSSITESDPEVTVHHLGTNDPESSTTEGVDEVRETSATDLGTLLDAGDGAVVTLVAGDTRLVAHRAVLAARSAMIREMVQAGAGEVAVPDVEGPVLRQLVAYLYSLQAPQLPGTATELLVAADRYGVPGLKAACEQQVAEQLSVENAVAAAVLALKHSCPGLQRAAVAFINAHTRQVVMTQAWADAVVSDPHSVVELTRLLAEPPAETSTPAIIDVGAPCQPHTPASDAPPTDPCHTPPPDDADVLLFQSLSGEEKSNRLIEAAKLGAVDKLQALLAAGADVGASDKIGATALHWAAFMGHVELVGCLLDAVVEVDARDIMDRTPLMWAAMTGNAAVVRLLLSSCADPNAMNQFGRTALHYAVDHYHINAATALFEKGANVCVRDCDGNTPHQLARQKLRNFQQLVDSFARGLHRCKCLE